MDSFEAKKTKSKISCLGTFKYPHSTVGTELERGDGTELEGAGTELEGGWDRTVNVEYSHSFLRTVRLLFVILMLEMYSRFFDPIEVTHPRVTIYESIDIIQVQDSPTFVLA